MNAVAELKVDDNTFFFYSSDHGYNLVPKTQDIICVVPHLSHSLCVSYPVSSLFCCPAPPHRASYRRGPQGVLQSALHGPQEQRPTTHKPHPQCTKHTRCTRPQRRAVVALVGSLPAVSCMMEPFAFHAKHKHAHEHEHVLHAHSTRPLHEGRQSMRSLLSLSLSSSRPSVSAETSHVAAAQRAESYPQRRDRR